MNNTVVKKKTMSPKKKVYFKKTCKFCESKDVTIDYKNFDMMRKFVTERGKILPRRMTGTCAWHQRKLTTALKRARILAYIPFMAR